MSVVGVFVLYTVYATCPGVNRDRWDKNRRRQPDVGLYSDDQKVASALLDRSRSGGDISADKPSGRESRAERSAKTEQRRRTVYLPTRTLADCCSLGTLGGQEDRLSQRDRATRHVSCHLVNCCTSVRKIAFGKSCDKRMTL